MVNQKIHTLIKKATNITAVIALILTTGIGQLFYTQPAHAAGYSWINGTITAQADTSSTVYTGYGDCTVQTVQTVQYVWQGYTDTTACVFTANTFRYAIMNGQLFIGSLSDTKMDPVINLGFASYTNVLPSPQTDDLIYNQLIVKDLPSKLTLVTGTTNYYVPNDPLYYNLAQDEQGNASYTSQGMAVSRNGQWVVMNVSNVGLVRVNLGDMSATWVAPDAAGQSLLAISNDGNFVAESSSANNWQPAMYSLTGCGQNASVLQSAWSGATLSNPCQSRDLSPEINAALGVGSSTTMVKPSFNDAANQLVVFSIPAGTNNQVMVTLTAPPTTCSLGAEHSVKGVTTREEHANSNANQTNISSGNRTRGDSEEHQTVPVDKCHVQSSHEHHDE